jgi:hypothetical protein
MEMMEMALKKQPMRCAIKMTIMSSCMRAIKKWIKSEI